MFRRLWAGFLSLLLIAGMLAAAPGSAAATMTEAEYLTAANQLNRYGLVQGDSQGYRFYSQITRAEMAKLLVYALGMQGDAARYVGRGAFADTEGHWADGVINLAKTVGIMNGYPEGDFRPQAPLTYAEVITALSRLVGLEAGSEPWPRTYLDPAIQAGIIPDEMPVYASLNDPAPRGDVFVMLWRTLTVVKNAQGQNLLRRYLDRSAPALTVDPLPAETTDVRLSVSGTAKDASQVLINGTAVAISFNTFLADVPLRVGPNTIRVQAIDDAGNLREQVIQVTRKASPVGNLSITGPAQVAVGQAVPFTINLLDQNGEAIGDRKSVVAEVSPATLGTFDPVTGFFTAGTAPGTGSIIVKAGGAQSSVAVTVTAGVLDHIQIEPPVAGVGAKESFTFAVKGFDAYNNPVPVGSAQWSASGGTIGSSSGVFTAPDTAGTFTVTARAAGKTATAAVQPPNFKAASVQLSQPTTSLKANGLSELTLTATVLDAQGNPVTDYKGVLTLSSSAAGVARPTTETVIVNAGVAQITVRAGSDPGTAQIKASTNLGASGTAAVTVAPQRLQSVRLEATALPATTPTANPTGYVEAIALDEDGNPMRSALPQTLVLRLTLTANGAAGSRAWFVQNDLNQANIALGPLDPAAGDVRTRTHLQYTPGIGTVLVEGSALSNLSWVQVAATALRADQVGMPSAVRVEPVLDTVAGDSRSIYVTVLDANGYRVTQASLLTGIQVRLKDQNNITYHGVSGAAEGAGRYRFDVTQTVAGTYTYTAVLQPAGATAQVTARVMAGPAAALRLTADPAIILADNASQTVLKAELVDAWNNRVTEPSYQIAFDRISNTGAIQNFSAQQAATRNGVAELTLRAGTVAAPEDFRATAVGLALPAATVTVTTRGVPERLAMSYGDNNGNNIPGESGDSAGPVGMPMTVYVDVLDRFGAVAAYDHGRQITLIVRNLRTSAETTLQPAQVKDGRATFYVTRDTADTFALKAQATGLVPAVTVSLGGALADLRVQAYQGLKYTVAPDLSTLRVGGTNYALIKATMVDAQGNPAPNQTGAPITVVLEASAEPNGATNYGKFTVDDSPGGMVTLRKSVVIPAGATESLAVRFFSGTVAGPKSITWSTPDGSRGSFAVQTIATAPVASLFIEAESGPLTNGGLTVTVTLKDSAGNRVSDADGPVTIKTWDVAEYFNPVTQAWALPTAADGTYTLNADRGQVRFRVRAATAGTKLYTVSYPGVSIPAQEYGTFYATGN